MVIEQGQTGTIRHPSAARFPPFRQKDSGFWASANDPFNDDVLFKPANSLDRAWWFANQEPGRLIALAHREFSGPCLLKRFQMVTEQFDPDLVTS